MSTIGPNCGTSARRTAAAGMFVFIAILAATILITGGCNGSQEQWRTAIMPIADYDAVFQATQQELAQDFEIAEADYVGGRIHTKPLEFSRGSAEAPGDNGDGGAYISSGAYLRQRRIVTARVGRLPESGAVRVDIRAEIQRESTTQAERMIMTQDIHDRPGLGMPQRIDYVDQQRAINWSTVGRDAELESQLLRRIQDRARQIAGGSTPTIVPVEPIVPGSPPRTVTPLESDD